MNNEHFTTRHYVTFAVIAILVVSAGLWTFNRLSSDAIGMALGLGFGVLAGIPAALLVFIARQDRPPYNYRDDDNGYREPQPTVIILQATQTDTGLAPIARPQRTFVIVPQTEQQANLPPWERTAPPPQASKYTYDENTTVWPYPITGMQIIGGEAERPVSGVTLTNTVEFALRTGAPCVVSLNEWERHVQAQSDAQGMNRYAFFR